MRWTGGELFMYAEISKNAELFLKAIEDVWVAEQIQLGSTNNAVWHCTQAVEKVMKGFLRCQNMDYDYGHQLRLLLEVVEAVFELSAEAKKNIVYLDDFGIGLRYKNMSDDPSLGDTKVAIARTKSIIDEFRRHPTASTFINEAEEVHKKILKASKTE